ncbi:MAG: carbon storage regulator [Candidatus Omnitrophota bacterium]|jgi:carbon storage regulator|nr:MAG: carbon storage regulator [Candidatus Omnitrophota bacterium]
MLVLSRKRDESIIIGDEVTITIVDIKGEQVKIGVTAPKSVSIHRKEVYEAIQQENVAAAKTKVQNLSGLVKVLQKKQPITDQTTV